MKAHYELIAVFTVVAALGFMSGVAIPQLPSTLSQQQWSFATVGELAVFSVPGWSVFQTDAKVRVQREGSTDYVEFGPVVDGDEANTLLEELKPGQQRFILDARQDVDAYYAVKPLPGGRKVRVKGLIPIKDHFVYLTGQYDSVNGSGPGPDGVQMILDALRPLYTPQLLLNKDSKRLSTQKNAPISGGRKP